MANENIDAIDAELMDAILGPKRVRSDAGEVEARDIEDYIKARGLIANGSSASRPRRGLRITKPIPPGAL